MNYNLSIMLLIFVVHLHLVFRSIFTQRLFTCIAYNGTVFARKFFSPHFTFFFCSLALDTCDISLCWSFPFFMGVQQVVQHHWYLTHFIICDEQIFIVTRLIKNINARPRECPQARKSSFKTKNVSPEFNILNGQNEKHFRTPSDWLTHFLYKKHFLRCNLKPPGPEIPTAYICELIRTAFLSFFRFDTTVH